MSATQAIRRGSECFKRLLEGADKRQEIGE